MKTSHYQLNCAAKSVINSWSQWNNSCKDAKLNSMSLSDSWMLMVTVFTFKVYFVFCIHFIHRTNNMIIIYLCHFCYHFTCYGLQKRTLEYSINWKHGSFMMAMMMQIIRNERLCMTWWYKLMWVVFWNSTCHSDENMIRNYTIEIVKMIDILYAILHYWLKNVIANLHFLHHSFQ